MGGSLLATNNTYADTLVTIPFEEVNMCAAVVSSVDSDKIEENNCSDETDPNIIMTDSNIESITKLFLSSKNISNITGIEKFENLIHLQIMNNQISDISPLENLVNLREAILIDNQISDLTPLSELTKLQSLFLIKNQISDISPLSGLTNLHYLGLAYNPINDIAPILSLDLEIEDSGIIGENVSTATTNSSTYELPSLFLLANNKLDLPENVAPWVNTIIEQYTPLIEWEFQNAEMNEDGKSITIQNINDPAVIAAYANIPGQERVLLAQVTVTYKESPEPEPTPTPDDPPVPNTGKNTQESSTAILTATLCILSGIILTAIPMTRLYRKTNSK